MKLSKNTFLRVLPDPVRARLSNTAWFINPTRIRNSIRFRQFANKHEGQRCFIIGNGPSLNRTNLSLLRNEITFGLNRIYLKFDELGFATTYYVAANKLVVEQCADEIARLPSPKFINWYYSKFISPAPDVLYFRNPQGEPTLGFSTRADLAAWVGSTVTYVAMQIAYYMGFKEVILVGVDHSFVTKGRPGEVVVQKSGDPNHFDPNYFGPGFRWQLPDLEGSEKAYRLAKYYFEKDGRRIVDATIGGKLQVFPKVDFASLFS
jgi:hypothetical protein